MCQKGTHLDSLASFGVVLSKAVSNCKAGRLFTPEEGGGTAAGLFRYSSVINWFRPPAGQPPGHHEGRGVLRPIGDRSEEHTSELQSLMRISYAVFCLKKKKQNLTNTL